MEFISFSTYRIGHSLLVRIERSITFGADDTGIDT